MNKEHNIALRPEKVIIAFDFFTVVCKLIWKFSVGNNRSSRVTFIDSHDLVFVPSINLRRI